MRKFSLLQANIGRFGLNAEKYFQSVNFTIFFNLKSSDYVNISLVCVKWYRIILGLRQLNRTTFEECFQNGQIYFRCFENNFSPAQRHSHSSAILNEKLFIFGGLSGTSTSYNDLWMFDLSTKAWSRPSSSGTYPSPKAAASFLPYDQSLILYGGYSHPYSYPFNQQVNFFDEFHVYDTKKHSWHQQFFSQDSPKLAGHSASIIQKSKLILFGGCNGSLGNKTNSIYCLDITANEWINLNRKIEGFRPEPRYGHSQITLDDERILIIGGCGGPNKQFDDLWILNWPKDSGLNVYWQQVKVNNLINSPSQLYCIPFVQCGQKIVTLGKPRSNINTSYASLHLNSLIQSNQSDVPLTIYGQNKQAQERKCTCSCNNIIPSKKQKENGLELTSESNKSDTANLNLLNKSQRNTIKRLEALKKIATKFNKLKDEKEIKLIQQLNSTTSLTTTQNNCVLHSKLMQLFVLDISNLFNPVDCRNDIVNNINSVNWQVPIAHFSSHSPSDTILYTLAKGIDEIILFGGMELDSQGPSLKPCYENFVKHRVSNKIYILKPNNLFISK